MQHPFEGQCTSPSASRQLQQEESSQLKIAIDAALQHTRQLRLALEVQVPDATGPSVKVERPLRGATDAETQTELVEEDAPSCSRWPLFAAVNPIFSAINPTFSATNTPRGKGVLRGPTFLSGLGNCRTPLQRGAVGAAVQQACVDLLSPHGRAGPYVQASAANSPAAWRVIAQPPCDCDQGAGTGASSSPTVTPQPERPSTLTPHVLMTPLSDISLADEPLSSHHVALTPHTTQQQRPGTDFPRGSSPHCLNTAAAAAAEPELQASWVARPRQPQAGAQTSAHHQAVGPSPCRQLYDTQPPLRYTPAASQHDDGASGVPGAAGVTVAAAAAMGPLAAWEPFEAFTPNTTALRLRAAMQWMRLQLQESACRAPRPRRYSDSAVSPARKILDGGVDQLDAGPEAGGSGAEVAVAIDEGPWLGRTGTQEPQQGQPARQELQRLTRQLPQQPGSCSPFLSWPQGLAESELVTTAAVTCRGGPLAAAAAPSSMLHPEEPAMLHPEEPAMLHPEEPAMLQPEEPAATTPVSKSLFPCGSCDSDCDDGGLSLSSHPSGTPLALPAAVHFTAGVRPLQDATNAGRKGAGGKAPGGSRTAQRRGGAWRA